MENRPSLGAERLPAVPWHILRDSLSAWHPRVLLPRLALTVGILLTIAVTFGFLRAVFVPLVGMLRILEGTVALLMLFEVYKATSAWGDVGAGRRGGLDAAFMEARYQFANVARVVVMGMLAVGFSSFLAYLFPVFRAANGSANPDLIRTIHFTMSCALAILVGSRIPISGGHH